MLSAGDTPRSDTEEFAQVLAPNTCFSVRLKFIFIKYTLSSLSIWKELEGVGFKTPTF